MFVLLSNDKATMLELEFLQASHDTESAIEFDELCKAPKELNGEMPRRITFLAHGTTTQIAGMSAEEFSNKLIKNLSIYGQINEDIKKSLTHIDLEACGVGHFSENCFALEVATRINQALKEEGFKEIQVCAATNLLSNNQNLYIDTYVILKKGGFCVFGIRSESDSKKIAKTNKKIAALQENIVSCMAFIKEYQKKYVESQRERGFPKKLQLASTEVDKKKSILQDLNKEKKNQQDIVEKNNLEKQKIATGSLERHKLFIESAKKLIGQEQYTSTLEEVNLLFLRQLECSKTIFETLIIIEALCKALTPENLLGSELIMFVSSNKDLIAELQAAQRKIDRINFDNKKPKDEIKSVKKEILTAKLEISQLESELSALIEERNVEMERSKACELQIEKDALEIFKLEETVNAMPIKIYPPEKNACESSREIFDKDECNFTLLSKKVQSQKELKLS